MLARPDFNVPPIKQALSSLQVHAQLTVTALTTGGYFTWTVCTFDLKDNEAFQNMTCTLIMSLSTGIKNINTRAHDEFNNIYFSAVIIHLKHDYDIWEINLLAFKHIVY